MSDVAAGSGNKNDDPGSVREAQLSARLAAVQSLYQMEQTGIGITQLLHETSSAPLLSEKKNPQLKAVQKDEDLFETLLKGVVEKQVRIDAQIAGGLQKGWRLERLPSLSRAIARASIFELGYHSHFAKAHIISDYLTVAESFFGDKDRAFLHALMDRIAKQE